MTARAVIGVLLLNVALAVVGLALLHALRPLRTVGEVARLGGLGYLLGVASVGVVFTFELVVGIPLGLAGMVATLAALFAAGLGVSAARGHGRPAATGIGLPSLHPVAALAAAGLVVYLESLFRVGRLTGLFEWDGWAFWVPKALTVHRYGGLEEQWFLMLPGPSYPPLVPALEAASFHAMGAVDPVTLHLQFWCLHVGFLWCLLGLLAGRVRQIVLIPLVLGVAVVPDIVRRVLDAQADLLVGYFVVAAAVLLMLWLDDRRPWHLPAATIVLAAAMLTKREGLLLAACLVVAAAIASVRQARAAWPRLAAVGGVAFALSLPWRIWFTSRDLPGDVPDGGLLGFLGDLDRGWPALRLSLETHFAFDLWRLSGLLLVAGAVLAFLTGCRRLGVFAGAVFVLAILGSAWVVWSVPDLPLTREGSVNPIVRLVGTSALLAAALLPLLVERLLVASGLPFSLPGVRRAVPAKAGLAAVALVALAYPLATLAAGLPTSPSVAECRPAAADGTPIRAVFGRFEVMPDALTLLRRVQEVGYVSAVAEPDGCGLVRVAVHGVPSLAGGADLAREASTVDLHPLLERDD